MGGMKRWLRRLAGASPPPRMDDDDWVRLLRRVLWVRGLSPELQDRLRALTERFLADKAITPAAELLLTPERRRLIALQCCRPILHLGYDWLQGWHEVIVYPGTFGVRRHDVDEATGVVAEWDDQLVGESWDRGPLILSWADVRGDIDRPEPGFDVVAHEIAHKLDALDGAMDGTPPLPDAAARAAWVRDMQAGYDAISAQVEAGGEPAIDAYAAEGPDEFFAVTSEYHFSAPQQLRAALPAVADRLAEFYGPRGALTA
jgi:Mlc titration factor MtfA (ptsG expression regulator)